MPDTKTISVVNSAILIFILIAFSFYVYKTDEKFSLVQEQFSSALEQQNNNIKQISANLVKYTDEKTSVLQQEVGTQLAVVHENIEKTKEETETNLNQLTGKITQVETQSLSKLSEVEERIKKINVKSADFSAIIPEIIRSVVSIRADNQIGSGVIVNSKGYVVTNLHVVGISDSISLRFANGAVAFANVVNFDQEKDLALLKIESEKTYKSLEFSPRVNTGEKVIAIGSPGGLDFTVTEGIVSNNERMGSNGAMYIQIDVPINPGNSGGPLINLAGNIVGINTMKVQESDGIGFAIHPRELQKFVAGSNIE